jgi:RHS repeat-associated protein
VQAFLYQDSLRPIAELDGAGNVASRFIYAGGHVPAYLTKGGATYRIVSDQLGSPRLVVDVATGAVAQRLVYDTFGNVTMDTNPGFQPFGFAGGLYDRDTGLVHFGAREYDPQTGRWTTKDPIGFAGGAANLYVYVGNDPVNGRDVTGLAGVLQSPLSSLTVGLARLATLDAVTAVEVAGGLGVLASEEAPALGEAAPVAGELEALVCETGDFSINLLNQTLEVVEESGGGASLGDRILELEVILPQAEAEFEIFREAYYGPELSYLNRAWPDAMIYADRLFNEISEDLAAWLGIDPNAAWEMLARWVGRDPEDWIP